jgi:hypothetical protein
VVAVALAGCSGRYQRIGPARPAAAPTPRAPTGGEAALAMLPEGADVVVELDLARARGNPTIGPLLDGWLGAIPNGDIPIDAPLSGAAWVVLAGYGVGGPDATTVTLLAPGTAVDVPNAVAIGDGVVALAPPAWIDRVRAVTDGAALADDAELMALRARAMPAAADGAVIRVTARLSDDARISLGGVIGLDPAPRAVSLWGDVADDAAIVVDLDARDGADPKAARQLRASLERLLHRFASRPEVISLGLAPPIARARIEQSRRGSWLRAILVVPPSRLRYAAARGGPEPAREAPAP